MMCNREIAVSSVISEMLLITIVLILVPVVTISLLNQMPEARTPTVTIIGGYSSDQISFYHKGGDFIKKEDIKIIIRTKDPSGNFQESGFSGDDFNIIWKGTSINGFDLGSELQLPKNIIEGKGLSYSEMYDIKLIVKNSVIYLYPV